MLFYRTYRDYEGNDLAGKLFPGTKGYVAPEIQFRDDAAESVPNPTLMVTWAFGVFLLVSVTRTNSPYIVSRLSSLRDWKSFRPASYILKYASPWWKKNVRLTTAICTIIEGLLKIDPCARMKLQDAKTFLRCTLRNASMFDSE